MASLQSKNPIFHHFRPVTAQERLRNGYRNGRETLELVANTSPSGDERTWEFSFGSDQASRRVSLARVHARMVVPPMGVVPGGLLVNVVTLRTRIPKLTFMREF